MAVRLGGDHIGRVLRLLDVHVRLLAQVERAVRPAAGATVWQQYRAGPGRGTSDGHVQPSVQREPWTTVRRDVPDAHPAPVDLPPGTRQSGAHPGFRKLLGPRHLQNPAGNKPTFQQPVYDDGSPVEDHALQAQSRVHVRQAEADVQPNQGVQRTVNAQLGR